ncbi:FecR family protein [Changchengzhania lutea]|uniref:FecR family protein n=1 Tax=Changchengzhania lutea TaxID=2049305 RepID=UPI00115CE59B|nr:FecR family protein [Changchengzhania lutea]
MEFKLIIKNLKKTLTAEERIIFSKWYNERKAHKNYFDNVKANYQNDIHNINIENGWKAIESKIEASKQKNNYWKYAIAASVVILISISYVFNKDNAQVNEPIIVNNTIEIGTDKAILTLEDGSDIMLGKGQDYIAGNLNSNGEELIYNVVSNSKAEIKYNYLTIPRGGQFHVILSDGTEVWLNSESQLKYPVAFNNGETRQVELVYGEAYFDVSSSTDHDGANFKVNTLVQEVEVLGTEFNIKAYKDETNISTTLVEGNVIVNFEGKKQNLVPNQQSNLNINTNTISVKNVDVYNETSWKDGIFSFEEKSLKEIMKVLSRWYDVDIVFKNKTIENEEFMGVLGKDQNLEEILSSIKNFGIIKDFQVKNKKVLLE